MSANITWLIEYLQTSTTEIDGHAEVIANVVAELQSVRQRLAALESK